MSTHSTPVALTSITGIRYGREDRPTLVLDLLGPYPLPDKPLPTVIRVTGPGWLEENRAGFTVQDLGIRFLAAAGFLTGAISVRLSWQAPFPAQIHDVKAAIRWLRAHAGDYPVDPDRIGILGDSAGGHLAALAGLTGDDPGLEGDSGSPGHSSAVQAVVTISAPADFLAFDDSQSTQPPPRPPIRSAGPRTGSALMAPVTRPFVRSGRAPAPLARARLSREIVGFFGRCLRG